MAPRAPRMVPRTPDMSPRAPRPLRLETLAVHAGMQGVEQHGSHVPPIDLSSTNPLPSIEEGGDAYEHLATGGRLLDGHSAVYQRLWQPGVARFEDALAQLESTPDSVAFSSGMAALTACLIATVSAGRPHVVAVRPLYGGTDHVLNNGLLGTAVTWATPQSIAASIQPDTGLVIVETPANPSLELIDIAQLTSAAGEVPVLIDNTFATPVLQRPAKHGASLVLHSATKYLGGHGDVVGGVVACNPEWASRLRQVRALTGGLLHPLAAYLLHRGLRTLPLRVHAQQATAAELARRLQLHDGVAMVRYPGLPGQDPQALIGRQMTGPGAILAVELVDGHAAAVAFVESCRLATHAVSLGGIDTLIQHPASLTHRPVVAHARPGADLVRISVGLEHVDDLTDDFLQALDRSRTATSSAAV